MKTTITMLLMFCTMCFAQKSIAKITQEASTSEYTKCLEKYKILSEQVTSSQAKCLQESQVQKSKVESDYAKCQETSGYTKCQQEYQTQETKIQSDSAKCLKEYKILSEQITSGKSKCQKGTFTDSRDGKTYKIVKIGTQTWMAENLAYDAKGSKCYGNKPANCDKYNRLYNWNTATKVCPNGWHLPNYWEWDILESFVGNNIAGKELKANKGWKGWSIDGGNGQDSYGFSALPGGYGFSSGGFDNVGETGCYWSTMEHESDASHAYYRFMAHDFDHVDKSFIGGKGNFCSVRCIQGDKEPDKESEIKALIEAKAKREKEVAKRVEEYIKANSGTFTDTRDKKNYKTIKIGIQTWMAENLNYAVEGSKCYDNKPANCDKYGMLYDWNTAMKACPSGWHLPSKDELDALLNYADGTKLKATSGWNSNSNGSGNGNGTDNYGFSALPGGYGNSDGNFFSVGNLGFWWGSSSDGSHSAYYRSMNNGTPYGLPFYYEKSNLLSVRCLQD